MASELDVQLAAILDRLTGPEGPLPLTAYDRGDGVMLPMFRDAPPTLPALFAHFCTQHGEAEFLVDGDVRLSFAATLAAAREIAGALVQSHGVRVGDPVGLAASNSANWVVAYMGILMAGGCAALLNGWWTGDELCEAVDLAGCRLVLADAPRAQRLGGCGSQTAVVEFAARDWRQGFAGLLGSDTDSEATLPQLGPDDLATILFTSGSTGRCKGAVSDHRAVVQATLNYAAQSLMLLTHLQGRGQAPQHPPCALVAVPLFHVTGEVPLFLQSFVLGRKLVLMPKWDAHEALQLIEAERVTYFVGVPLMSYEIATHPQRDAFDLSSCSFFAAGGAPRPPEHVGRLRAELPHAYPLIGYGLTETNAVGCANCNENYLAKPGSTGPASRPLVEVAIRGEGGAVLPQGEVGEVAIRSIANVRGYWNDPEATAAAFTADGFFLTGDLGRVDEDGYLFIVDRKKDIIIRGGENIASIEVEQALYSHPDIAEACVFGLPDPRLGEVPVAVFTPKPGRSPSEAELRAFLGRHLAPFKIPAAFFTEAQPLPRLGTEKVDKRALRSRYAAQWEAARPAP